MADVPISYANADKFGVPAFEVLDQHLNLALLNSGSPALSPTVRVLLASSLTLALFSVVGLDAAGKLALAVTGSVDPDDDIAAIGVLAHAATSGAGNTTKFGEVWLTGDFNVAADSPLVWDASFSTVALKTAATKGNPNLIFRSRTATGSPAV